MEDNNSTTCLICKKNDEEVPLFRLTYRGEELRICPQHIPVLIHDPQKLVGMLDGADKFTAG